ncbi:MAG: hypothetical protein ACYC1I_11750 [Acidimicrobiales bacterium]
MSTRKQSAPTLDLPIDLPDEATTPADPASTDAPQPPSWMIEAATRAATDLGLALSGLPNLGFRLVSVLADRDVTDEIPDDHVYAAFRLAVPTALAGYPSTDAEKAAATAWIDGMALRTIDARKAALEAHRSRMEAAAAFEVAKAEHEAELARKAEEARYADVEAAHPGFLEWRASQIASVEASA